MNYDSISIKEILCALDKMDYEYEFVGDCAKTINGFSSLSNYKPGTFTWINSKENIPDNFDISTITLAFVSTEIKGLDNYISTKNSRRDFFYIIEHFFDDNKNHDPIGKYTYISPNVHIGKNVRIGHNCTLDGEIFIGDNTVIENNVVVTNRVYIGENCNIHSGTVIGHDGFAYTEADDHSKIMIKHFGGVKIGNDVTIFDNVCITRGTIDDTVIEDGVKIDSLSHIAHNVVIRKNASLAAPCHLNGSVEVGENSYIANGVVRNQRKIGKNAFVGLGAVVVKNVEDNSVVVGNPAKPFSR